MHYVHTQPICNNNLCLLAAQGQKQSDIHKAKWANTALDLTRQTCAEPYIDIYIFNQHYFFLYLTKSF